MPEASKVYVVTQQEWDTEGNSHSAVAGVFTSKDKIPAHMYDAYDGGYRYFSVTEIELDKVERWV